MLNRIIQYSLDNRMVIIILSLILLAGGLFTVKEMEIDVFPDLTAPTVVVLTDAHGMAAEEVDGLLFPAGDRPVLCKAGGKISRFACISG